MKTRRIYASPNLAAAQAAAAGHDTMEELLLLTVHGVLHLLGYDHAEPEEEKEMFALQNQILAEWYEHLRALERAARQAEKDRRLLGKTGFFTRSDDA